VERNPSQHFFLGKRSETKVIHFLNQNTPKTFVLLLVDYISALVNLQDCHSAYSHAMRFWKAEVDEGFLKRGSSNGAQQSFGGSVASNGSSPPQIRHMKQATVKFIIATSIALCLR